MTTQGTVVIAGAAGFLGGYAVRVFGASGWSVYGIDRAPGGVDGHPASPSPVELVEDDLSNPDGIVKLLDEWRPDVWLQFAGPSSVARSFTAPCADFDSSVLPLRSVLDAIRISGASTRLLLASSAAVYGEPDVVPVPETHRVAPMSPYGYHKYVQELALDEYFRLYGVRVCKARMFSTYGPGLRQLAVWDIARRALAGDFTIFGSGAESRDYLFAEDVARAIRCICEEAPFLGEAVNVASGRETPIVDMARIIYSTLGIQKEPQVVPAQVQGNPVRWCADTTKLRGFAFEPGIELDAGIARTMEWIRSDG